MAGSDKDNIARYLAMTRVDSSPDDAASESPFEQFEFDFMKGPEAGDGKEITETENG